MHVRWMLCILLCVFIATIASPFVQAGASANLDPNLPYQAKKSNPVTYEVDFSAVVTPPYHAEVLKIWLPMPQSDSVQEVTEGELSSFPQKVRPQVGIEKVYGNKFAYFEFKHPAGAQMVRHKFKIKVWELHWDIDPAKVVSVKKWPVSFAPFLRDDEKQSVIVNDYIRKFTLKLVPTTKGQSRDFQSVFTWVNDNMKYDHKTASLSASSVNALEKTGGHCSDYHGLCSAMGRALGYPTRLTYGINPFPKNSPSHCKMEAFLPPYGWVCFDVSETQQFIKTINANKDLEPELKAKLAQAAKDRLFKGFRDNTWFLQTRGSDYELVPPAAKKAAVVRTIYAEADGVAFAEPDPANQNQRAFSWMTMHDYRADRVVTYPFTDWKSLQKP